MAKLKAGRITDAELVRRRREGASLSELARASGLSSLKSIVLRLIRAMGLEYYACGPPRGRGSGLRRARL
jgi:hypothetical protein